MNVGMLWLDAEGAGELVQRLTSAARYYEEKYGRRAGICVVHPETAGEQPPKVVADMVIRVRSDVLRQHFWLGEPEGTRQAA